MIRAAHMQHAYLGQSTVAVPDAEGTLQWRQTAHLEEGIQTLAEAAAALFNGKRTQLTVWLGAALARPFLMQPVAGLKGWREAQRLAQGLAPERTGLLGPCRVWLDAGLPNQAVLGVAIDESTHQSVHQGLAKVKGLRLASLQPWWTQALRQALQQEPSLPMLVVQEPDAWTLLAGQGGSFALAATCWPLPEPAQAAGWVRRTLLGADLPVAQGLHAALQTDAARPGEEPPAHVHTSIPRCKVGPWS